MCWFVSFQLLPVGLRMIVNVQDMLQRRHSGSQSVPKQEAQAQYSPIQDFDLHDSPVTKKRSKPRKTWWKTEGIVKELLEPLWLSQWWEMDFCRIF